MKLKEGIKILPIEGSTHRIIIENSKTRRQKSRSIIAPEGTDEEELLEAVIICLGSEDKV